MKSKIPLGKKPKALDDELDENEASESQSDASGVGDKTGLTEISSADLSNDGTQSDVSSPVAEENKSLVHKLKRKFEEFQTKKKGTPTDELYPGSSQDGAPEKSDSAAKAKKIRLILIGLVAILAILFLVPDEGEDMEVSEAPVKLKPRKRPVKKNIKIESEAGKEATPPTEAPADSTNTATTTTPVETAPPVLEEGTTETASTGPVITEPVITEPVITEPVITEPVITETPPGEAATETTPPSETPVDVATSSSDMVDSIDGTVTTDPTNSESITDQILEDLEKQVETKKPVEIKKEYVSPPDYEYFGRGLVYNCAGKHWACVDAPSYKTCEDNSSSVKYLNKKKECYPYNVYETAKGCQSIQNRMVSSSAKTNFCE